MDEAEAEACPVQAGVEEGGQEVAEGPSMPKPPSKMAGPVWKWRRGLSYDSLHDPMTHNDVTCIAACQSRGVLSWMSCGLSACNGVGCQLETSPMHEFDCGLQLLHSHVRSLQYCEYFPSLNDGNIEYRMLCDETSNARMHADAAASYVQGRDVVLPRCHSFAGL